MGLSWQQPSNVNLATSVETSVEKFEKLWASKSAQDKNQVSHCPPVCGRLGCQGRELEAQAEERDAFYCFDMWTVGESMCSNNAWYYKPSTLDTEAGELQS